MIRFECDYAEGAAPQILERLTQTNLEQTPGYAVDKHCQRARELIREACGAPQAAVEFLVGGTQTNQTVISAALRPYQGVLCAQTGHINTHETGAIEATGHKVLALPSQDGRITPEQVERFCAAHWADPTREHTVQPGMLYLSQPTETGLLYSRAELEGFRAVCGRYGMYLYIDGARCGYGLARAGERCEAHRPGPSDGRILHRRHQGGGPVRRGGGHLQPRSSTGFPILHQAPRRDAGQGPIAGPPVRGAV